MEVDVLFFNFLLYLGTFLCVLKFSKKNNLYILIWLAYTIVAFFGYYCVEQDMHYSRDVNLGYKLELAPYVFAYISVIIISYPFKRIDENRVTLSDEFPKWLKDLFYVAAALFVVQGVVSAVAAYIVANTIGYGEAYIMGHEGQGLGLISSPVLNRLFRFSVIFTESILPFYMVFFFQKLSKSDKYFYLNLFFLAVGFAPKILNCIAGGSKGGLFFVSFSIMFYYFLFKHLLSPRANRRFFVVGLVLGAVMIFYVVTISLSRFEAQTGKSADKRQQETEIVHYLGEAFPNLGYFYYGKINAHPYGRRFFPEFFSENAEDYYKEEGLDAKFRYWAPKTGVNMALFKTFWGDWYLEFGLIGSFVGIFVLVGFFYVVGFKRYWKISNISVMSFYFINVVVQGCFTGSGIEGSSKHKTIVIMLIIAFILKRYNNSKSYIEKKDDGKEIVSHSNTCV